MYRPRPRPTCNSDIGLRVNGQSATSGPAIMCQYVHVLDVNLVTIGLADERAKWILGRKC